MFIVPSSFFSKLSTVPSTYSVLTFFSKKNLDLITKSLKKYKSLAEVYTLDKECPMSLRNKRQVLFHTAQLISLAHRKNVKIQSLYPKHVFIHQKVFLKLAYHYVEKTRH